MAKFIGICVVVFVLAAGFLVVSQAQDFAALFEAFRAESLPHKLAWFVIVLVLLALIPSALWLSDALTRQRKAADALEARLGGVRAGVKALVVSQVDADAAIHHLARTDPEEAIGAVSQRLAEAERTEQVQAGRNDIGDLQIRVDELRAQQKSLRERLVPVLEKRRAIEQLFVELDSGQRDIDNVLTEIASGDDAAAIEVRLNALADFVKQGHARGDAIEEAAKRLARLKEDYSGLRSRFAPYAAADDGIARRIKELSDARDRLAADIDGLLHSPQGDLAARVQSFADGKKTLEAGMDNLEQQFARLAGLRTGVEELSKGFDRALANLAANGKGEAGAAEVAAFVKQTQARFDEIEAAMVRYGKLRTDLGALQARLAPLEAQDGGVADLVVQVKDICDRLLTKIARIETDEDGGLEARVQSLTKTRQDLEKRVASVTEQFSQLAAIRNDIAGLFDKLSNAAGPSSN
jgi:DNA repair exonuclease SbcCD ATPase subunit